MCSPSPFEENGRSGGLGNSQDEGSLNSVIVWDYVGSVGYNEDMVTTVLISEWTVRKLCAGDIPSDISKACAMVQETILTASRLVVL